MGFVNGASVVNYAFLQCNLSYVFMLLATVLRSWLSLLDESERFEFLEV